MINLFSTSGIRGHSETFFTPQFCFDLGRTFAQFLTYYHQRGAIAVGSDPRQSSPKIKKSFIKGLTFENRLVFDEGVIPTPAMCYILQTKSLAGSAIITGSHISTDLNGLKFFFAKEEFLPSHTLQFERIYENIQRKVIVPLLFNPPYLENAAREAYTEFLVSHSKPAKSLKILIDCANGTQSEVMPRVLSRLGHEVVEQNCDIQGDYLARDSEKIGVLFEVEQAVLAHHADLGIAFDGDGDRVMFVNSDGQFIHGDYVGTLLAKHSLEKNIVTTVVTSQVIDSIGKNIFRTPVGSPHVLAKINELQSTFGFEPNGGFIHSDVLFTRDGGLTAIRLLNLLTETKKTLTQLVQTLPQFYLYKDKTDCPAELHETIFSQVKKNYPGKFDTTDGLKIWLADTDWVLFRPSRTAPEFRVIAESTNAKTAHELGEAALTLVKQIISP